MFTIRTQFLGFSLDGWRDHYEIRSKVSDELALQVVSETLGQQVSGRSCDGAYIFRRGTRFWTWFSFGPEHWPLQEVSVRLDSGVVHIEYHVLGGIWFRGKPCGLEKEARLIAARLEAGEQGVDRKPDNVSS